MQNATVSFNIKVKKRLKVASWLERNVPFIFESKNIQQVFRNHFKKIENCVKINL